MLSAHTSELHEAVDAAIAEVATQMPFLAARVATQVAAQRKRGIARERLFASVVAAAMGGSPRAALPVCTVSSLLWAGVGDTGTGEHLTGAALIALNHIGSTRTTKDRRLRWVDDVTHSVAAATEAVFAYQARHFHEITRQNVLSYHLGLSGAAYARDAVMTARLFTEDTIEAWRRFGLMYGLLHDLATDHRSSTVDEDGNPDLVIPELLLAHALSCTKSELRVELALLHQESRADARKRETLRDLLRSRRVVSAYETDLRGFHLRACAELDALNAVPEYRDLLRSSLDDTLALVMPLVREVVGL